MTRDTDDVTEELLDQSEGLDSDEIPGSDGDDVVDPPERWTESDSYGTTEAEAARGESLDNKLSAEEPDPGA